MDIETSIGTKSPLGWLALRPGVRAAAANLARLPAGQHYSGSRRLRGRSLRAAASPRQRPRAGGGQDVPCLFDGCRFIRGPDPRRFRELPAHALECRLDRPLPRSLPRVRIRSTDTRARAAGWWLRLCRWPVSAPISLAVALSLPASPARRPAP